MTMTAAAIFLFVLAISLKPTHRQDVIDTIRCQFPRHSLATAEILDEREDARH